MVQNSSYYIKAKSGNDNKLIVGFFVVIACVLGYYGFISHQTTSAAQMQSDKIAQRFIAELSSHDYVNASKLLTVQARSSNPPSAISALVAHEEQNQGPWVGVTQVKFKRVSLYGLEFSKLTYDVKFEHGNVPLRLSLVHNYEGWQVDSFSFDG